MTNLGRRGVPLLVCLLLFFCLRCFRDYEFTRARRMWKAFWWGTGAVAVILVFALWTCARSTFLYHHPRAKDVRIVIDHQTGAAVVAALADPKSAAAASQKPLPLARVDYKSHDFGVMDPMSRGTHRFVVRNAGQAPLELTNGPT